MNRFSPDGLWWWDGTQWVATAEVRITPPMTEFERSGGLQRARGQFQTRDLIFWGFYFIPLWPILLPAYMVVESRAYKGYRQWSLELLALATDHLLGPDEPMLAGETTLWPRSGFWPRMKRDYAVAVTKAHVLMFLWDHEDSPNLRVIFAARPEYVEMTSFKGLLRASLGVYYVRGRWFLPGVRWIFKGQPVVDAWRQSRQMAQSEAMASATATAQA